MSTKRDRKTTDCYERAWPDEPMFVLLARDPQAPALVTRWANERQAEINDGMRPSSDSVVVSEALKCARDMEAWRTRNWRK